jgi:hypothetical protein
MSGKEMITMFRQDKRKKPPPFDSALSTDGPARIYITPKVAPTFDVQGRKFDTALDAWLWLVKHWKDRDRSKVRITIKVGRKFWKGDMS